MKIQNISTQTLQFPDIVVPGAAGGCLILEPNAITILFNEDAEKSNILKSYLDQELVNIISDQEPNDGELNADPTTTALLASDKLVQFIKNDDTLATNDPEIYTADTNQVKAIRIVLTDSSGARDYLNSVSTVLISASGGTVNGAASVTKTFVDGLISVDVLRATDGNVDLTLSAITHPLSDSIPPVTLTAATAAQVQFSS